MGYAEVRRPDPRLLARELLELIELDLVYRLVVTGR